MRDVETVETALKAAETGHLVISTLHTPDAATTVGRLLAMFPPEQQEIARVRLAEALQGVVSQRLLPRADGHGRAAAVEIMICTDTARDLIKDPSLTGELHAYIRDARDQYGMQTFDQHLVDLVAGGEVAERKAPGPAAPPAHLPPPPPRPAPPSPRAGRDGRG